MTREQQLEAALRYIDALDPEWGKIDGCAPAALRGLVLRMGEIARDALGAALATPAPWAPPPERLARWAYTFVMSERWRAGADRVEWTALRDETKRFWIDEAERFLTPPPAPWAPPPEAERPDGPRIIHLPYPMHGYGICVGGRWDGWLFWHHPDGQWVSKQKLYAAPLPAPEVTP
jgi:hypothetical protein